jgi:hypothetical protein
MFRRILSWWRGLPRHTVDGGYAVLLAFGFWATILILILLSTAAAAAKGNPFSDVVAALGAAAQAFFAFMVWRLSKQQFAFMKRVAHRQARIDTYGHRLEAFNRYIGSRKNFYLKNLDEAGMWEINRIGDDVERLFSRETSDLFNRLSTRGWNLQEKQEEIEEANRAGDDQLVHRLMKERAVINSEVRELTREVYRALNDELRIDPD